MPHRAAVSGRAAGFTLLEILVVFAIAALLIGTVILGFTGADDAQRLRGTAERIQIRIELARESALLRNREWGVQVRRNAYRFVEFDPITVDWVEQSHPPFISEGLGPRIEFELQVEGFDFDPGAGEDADLPDIILFSSGEVTPFRWTVAPAWDAPPWIVSSDGLNVVAATQGT